MKYSIRSPSSSLRNGVLLRWITIIKKKKRKKRLFHYKLNLINEKSFFTSPNRIKPKTNFTSKSINGTKTTEKIITLTMRICSRNERFTRALYVWMHFMVIIRRTCREEVRVWPLESNCSNCIFPSPKVSCSYGQDNHRPLILCILLYIFFNHRPFLDYLRKMRT